MRKLIVLACLFFIFINGHTQFQERNPFNGEPVDPYYKKLSKHSSKKLPAIVNTTNTIIFDSCDVTKIRNCFNSGDEIGEQYNNKNVFYYRNYYDEAKRKIKEEYIRMSNDTFYYQFYDTNFKVVNYGQFLLSNKINYTYSDTSPIRDINTGEVSKYLIYRYNYKLLKRNGFWKQTIDTNSYFLGTYNNNLKDGIWSEFKKVDSLGLDGSMLIQRKFIYNNDKLIRIDTINEVLLKDTHAEKMLKSSVWSLIDASSLKGRIMPLYKQNKLMSGFSYYTLKLYKDGTYETKIKACGVGLNNDNHKHTWTIENKILLLKTDGEISSKFEIIYLNKDFQMILKILD